jgi:dihydrofolate reductase
VTRDGIAMMSRTDERLRPPVMKIISRLATSADGYVTTPDGWPAQTADAAFAPGTSHGIAEFLQGKEAALMGAATFALAEGGGWPWPNLDVFVLGSERPGWTPEAVVYERDPAALLERVRATNRGGDVHLIGGPTTIATFHALGALDELQLVVLPLLLGAGLRLTPAIDPATQLRFTRSRPLDGGSVEIVYEV